jgi:hypothetical protein
MRAPDDKKPLRLPGFSRVPKYSPVERACRLAGEIPKTDKVNRARAHRGVLALLRQGVSAADGAVIADYLEGKFDLKNRPPNLERQYWLSVVAERVEATQRERDCTQDEAIKFVFEHEIKPKLPAGAADDEKYFSYIKNYVKR